MYANDNVTQTKPQGQFSRRDFLAALPGFGLLAGASLVATRAARAVLSGGSTMEPPEETVQCVDCGAVLPLASSGAHVCPYVPPVDFPDAARAAIITTWERKLDRVMVSLESLWFFLHEARTLPPADVDGDEFSRLEQAAFVELGNLSAAMETSDFEQLYLTLTGRRAYFWCLKEAIESSPGEPAIDLLSEINELAEDDPAGAAELLVLLQGAR